jgi:Tfp pilus assembly protein PilF
VTFNSAHSKLVLLLVLSATFGCAAGGGRVTRIADGVEYEGRSVSAEAYAEYSRGALLEASGDDANALSAYQAARAEDPDSPEILARIGGVSCRLARVRGDAHAVLSDESFDRAVEVDPSSARAWIELARCAARRGDAKKAEAAALNAARFDATAPETALLVIELAAFAGDTARARIWLDELVVRFPKFRRGWQALREFGLEHGDVARRLRAERALRELDGARAVPPNLENALSRDELERARSEAKRLGLRPSELALYAVHRGAITLARAQAELVLAADPDNADAWIARLAASDLSSDPRARFETLERSPENPSSVSKLGGQLLAELLERLIGPEARAAWEAAFER